jgi:hypothetical protein
VVVVVMIVIGMTLVAAVEGEGLHSVTSKFSKQKVLMENLVIPFLCIPVIQ